MRNIVIVNTSLFIAYLMFVPAAKAADSSETTYKFTADRTVNHVLHAVPTRGAVTLDGRLDEWDKSGGILCCKNVNRLINQYATWFYMMYDQDAVYLAAKVTDYTPMVNEFDPRFEQMICHRGDTVFFRIQSEEKYTNYFFYYWSVGKKAAVVLADGEQWSKEQKFSDGIVAGCSVAFRKFDDRKGYVVESRIPWSVITGSGQSHRPGEILPAAVGTYWNGDFPRSVFKFNYFDLSDKDRGPHEQWWYPRVWGTVKLSGKGNLSLPTPPWLVKVPIEKSVHGPIPIEYELPTNASVTIVVEDQNGRRVRNLVADVPRTAGPNVEHWDGADDEGQLVPPGTYRWRGLYHGKLVPTYELAFGPGDPPWDTADGKGGWLADHSAPEAVAADEEHIYLASPYAEAGSPVIAIDYDGKKQWGVRAPMYLGKSGTALAADETFLFVALDAREKDRVNEIILYRVDKATGIHEPFPDGNAYHVVGTYDRRLLPTARSHANWIAAGDHNADWNRCTVLGMAYDDGKLYMSSYLQNKILVIDCNSGEVTHEIQIARPAGLAVGSRGRLLAVSGRQVVAVEANSGQTRPVIPAQGGGLHAPVALATDQHGNIFVSDWAGEMCVKVFSPQGKFLRRVGKRSGRPWLGAWDSNGMLLPSGIAVDNQDRLWVAEKDVQPKRTSVWSSSGQFLREFIGPAFYKNVGTHVNPYDPTQALLTGCELKLDWKTAEWRPVATIWRSTHPMSLFGPAIGQHGVYRTIRLDEREFLISTTRHVVISEKKGDRYQPLAALGHVEAFVHGYQGQAMNTAYGELRLALPMFDNRRIQAAQHHKIKNPEVWEYAHDAKTNFYWADRNGDALVQEDEIEFFEAPGTEPHEWDFFFSMPVGDDLTIYPYVRGGQPVIWRLPLKGWTDCGAPLYQPQKAEIIATWMRKRVPGMGNSGAWVFADGEVLSIEAPMALFDRSGKSLWTYPNDWPGSGGHHAPGARSGLVISAGYAIGEANLGGEIGTIFGVRGGFGEDYLFTLDGLYIANLFRDCRAAPQAYPQQAVRGTPLADVTVAASGEPYGGCLFQHPDSGKVYTVIGTEAPCICEIRGLETIRRLPARELEFTRHQYDQAEKLLVPNDSEQTKMVFKLAQHSGAPKIDGDIKEWESTPSVAQIHLDLNHSARVRAAFDNRNLYLAYRVRDRMLLANGGNDWMMLFKTGSAVDFQIATDSEAPTGRNKPVEGDQRIVMALFEGEPIAVLYKYVVPDASKPQTFSSPIGTVEVDVVKRIEDAQIAISKGEDEYTLEAAIPLEALDFHPQAGQKFQGDFGVIWSDALGKRNAARCYWSNNAAGIVADLFSETKIDPKMWGKIEIVE